MLKTLIIKDFAIIHRLEVNFGDGMTVLTGETGAGKSIIINALNLLLGGRASTDVIRSSEERAVVEGAFLLQAPTSAPMRARLDELDIDIEDDTLIVRRIVSRSGRNKVLVNGSLLTVKTLRDLMRSTVDISGQHEHYSLLDPTGHVGMLDRFAGTAATAATFGKDFAAWRTIQAELETLRQAARDRLARVDYLRYQLNELEDANLVVGEEQGLEDELGTLSNAEGLRELTTRAGAILYDGDGAVVDMLDPLVRELRRASEHAARLGTMADTLEQARALIDDVVFDLRAFQEFDADPGRLDEVENRLTVIDRLKRKFGRSVGELIDDIVRMREELEQLEGAESRIDALTEMVVGNGADLLERGRELSKLRRSAAQTLEGHIERELANLGMASSELTVSMETTPTLDGLRATGIDQVEFLLSPNPGEDAKPLARIASGGELSRVMLAIKQVFVEQDIVSTYVFDEVDTGIGGAIADKVARALRSVSHDHQVLCITHLASIASYADHHFAIEKHIDGERTVSELRLLDEDERVAEIARMLGGLSITERSLEHAAEMVERARVPAEGA